MKLLNLFLDAVLAAAEAELFAFWCAASSLQCRTDGEPAFVPVGKNGIRVFEVRLMQTCHGALACFKDDVRVKTVLVRPAADISDLGGNQLASGNAERVHHGVVHFAKNRGTLLGLLDGRDMLICPAKCDFFYVSDAGVIVAHTALNQVYDQLGGKSEHIIKIEKRIDVGGA